MISSVHKNPLGQFDGQADIGSVHLPGSCNYDPEQQAYTIAGAGLDIWGDHAAFHFVWKRLTGDFIVTMRAAWFGAGINPHRKFGWMARARLAPTSPHVSTAVHGDGLLSLQFRRTPGGLTVSSSWGAENLTSSTSITVDAYWVFLPLVISH